jgi:phosphatidylserine/phosphatidylglycerophosphate/cardiolipin synthase-like enzyme
MHTVFLFALLALAPVLHLTDETDLTEKFVDLVERETVSIRMASHRLSDVTVVKSLVEAHKKGVSVEVIVDPITITAKSPVRLLAKEGVPVFVFKGGKKKGQMHHGFCLFGEAVSWSGSYSFSLKRLFSHRESALVLEEKRIADDFLREFEKMKKDHAEPFLGTDR